MQGDSRSSYYALASSLKEKASTDGTSLSAVSGLAASKNDALNFFSKYKFSYFPFSVRFLHFIFFIRYNVISKLEKDLFSD